MKNIFVFGSNREGRHGKGAALTARQKYGAVYGTARGLQGDSYAIVTKELRRHEPPVTLEEVAEGVRCFLMFAEDHADFNFYVSPIGCGLAGFTHADIAPMFIDAPPNCVLPPEWIELNAKR